MNHLLRVMTIVVFILFGCQTVHKAKLSSTDPNKAMIEVMELRDSLIISQVDLLANDEFEAGESKLNVAIESINNQDSRDETILKLSESKAYFLDAVKQSKDRAYIPKRILSARAASLINGVHNDNVLKNKLIDIDDSLIYRTMNFSVELNVEVLSSFEKRYLDMEVKTVQNLRLNVFRNIIENAEDNNANKIATKTLIDAKNSLRAAENMIAQSPRNPKNYSKNIQALSNSTKLLRDVMRKLRGVANGSSESAALAMVFQERKLGILSDRTSLLQSSLEKSQKQLHSVESQLKTKSRAQKMSTQKVRLQFAMDSVDKNFSKDEAFVFQQGNKIIIRLKKINFKSGSSMVPSRSMKLLSKVNSSISDLNASKVEIQGHTDSTGPSGSNQLLSLKRSEAVARYLGSLDRSYEISSKGYGESKPIANNQTKFGRAINRRVDIIVDTN